MFVNVTRDIYYLVCGMCHTLNTPGSAPVYMDLARAVIYMYSLIYRVIDFTWDKDCF